MDSTGYLAVYGDKSLHQQSHGESFMATLTNKLRGNAFYIIDEPEAALSPAKQLAATHSHILLAYPRAKIYHFSKDGIIEINYRDTEHYTITKYFFRLISLLE